MATSSLLLSPLSSGTFENRETSSNIFSSFLQSPKLTFTAKPGKSSFRRCKFKSPVAQKSLDHIPKQFREENLKDGMMDNYKNAPQYLYGLTPSQMDMFMTEDNPVSRQAEKVTEESISSSSCTVEELEDMEDPELLLLICHPCF
ncbi:unnamed protein product [Fraxinus pennsylvanica]|uniref:Uncharacterized protein n=1 Tax=Fraxinus pennsylvanica TaxID=56036 RepID=A0AAD2EBP4_9LAMI|nr:unnamed protein product [Fraxinus pennsylvanica]